MQSVFDLSLGEVGKFEGRSGRAGESHPHDLLGVGILFGDDRLLDIVGKFIADAADAVAHILGAHIHVAIQVELDRDGADLFPRFAPQDLDSRDIINFLLHRLGHVRFDQFSIGAGVDGGDGNNGGIDIGKFTHGETGKADDPNDGEGQVKHDGRNRSADTKFGKIHPRGEGVLRISFFPGARRRLPERAI